MDVPKLPDKILPFRLNQALHEAYIDEGPLHEVLDQILEYVQGVLVKAGDQIQEDVNRNLSDIRLEFTTQIEDSILDVEQRMVGKLAKVEKASAQVMEKADEMEKLAVVMQQTAARPVVVDEDSVEFPPPSEAAEAEGESSEVVVPQTGGGNGNIGNSLTSPMSSVTESRYIGRNLAADEPRSPRLTGGRTREKIPPGLEETLDALRSDLDDAKFELQRIGYEVVNNNHLDVGRQREIKEGFEAVSLRFAKMDHGQEQSDEERKHLAKHAMAMDERFAELDEAKALKTELSLVQASVEALRDQARSTDQQVTGTLSLKVEKLRESIQTMEQSNIVTCEAVEKNTHVIRRVQVTADETSTRVKSFDRRIGDVEHALEQQDARFSQHSIEVSERLDKMEGDVIAVPQKADRRDMVVLHDAVARMAQETKAKEQSVLFGAKCLSCNRTFDDIVPTAGTVDLHSERQRAQLMAEVQHALHGPGDAAPLKLLSVQVGRPGNTLGKGTGPYNTREACFGVAVEDLHIVRPPSTKLRPTAGGATPRRPPRQKQDEGFQGGRPKEGPMDFKHPLSKLLGRSGGVFKSTDNSTADRYAMVGTPDLNDSPGRHSPTLNLNNW